jgi:hypothetical protein
MLPSKDEAEILAHLDYTEIHSWLTFSQTNGLFLPHSSLILYARYQVKDSWRYLNSCDWLVSFSSFKEKNELEINNGYKFVQIWQPWLRQIGVKAMTCPPGGGVAEWSLRPPQTRRSWDRMVMKYNKIFHSKALKKSQIVILVLRV